MANEKEETKKKRFLKIDGGGVEIIEVSEEETVARFTGSCVSCAGCPMEKMNFKNLFKRLFGKVCPGQGK